MKIKKWFAYRYVLLIWLMLCASYQGLWLFSKSIYARVESFGHGDGKRWKHVENVSVSYVVSGTRNTATFLRNEWENSDSIPIRYLVFAPGISRPDTTAGNWGLVIATSSIFFICFTCIFLTTSIVPRNAIFVRSNKFPFVRMMSENPA